MVKLIAENCGNIRGFLWFFKHSIMTLPNNIIIIFCRWRFADFVSLLIWYSDSCCTIIVIFLFEEEVHMRDLKCLVFHVLIEIHALLWSALSGWTNNRVRHVVLAIVVHQSISSGWIHISYHSEFVVKRTYLKFIVEDIWTEQANCIDDSFEGRFFLHYTCDIIADKSAQFLLCSSTVISEGRYYQKLNPTVYHILKGLSVILHVGIFLIY